MHRSLAPRLGAALAAVGLVTLGCATAATSGLDAHADALSGTQSAAAQDAQGSGGQTAGSASDGDAEGEQAQSASYEAIASDTTSAEATGSEAPGDESTSSTDSATGASPSASAEPGHTLATLLVDPLGLNVDLDPDLDEDAAEEAAPAEPETPSTVPVPIVPVREAGSGITVVASSTASDRSVQALTDAGDAATNDTGEAWEAASSGEQWVELRFDEPRTISAVELFGSDDDTGTVSWGQLAFSDGTSVLVGGVIAGDAPPTTVAFPSRTVTSVRFEITGTLDGTPASLREIVVHDTGSVVPQYVGADASTLMPTQTATAAQACETPFGDVDHSRLHLVCPDTGATLTGVSSIVLAGPRNTTATVTAWAPASSGSSTGSVTTIGTVALDSNGYGTFTPSVATLADLMAGPLPLRFTLPDGGDLTAQFWNPGGVPTAEASSSAATDGLALVYDLDFREDVSIAKGGVDALFSSNKPNSGGTGDEYGAAIFADPSAGYGNLTRVADEYLRMRTSPLPEGESDPNKWGRDKVGGMLASGGAAGSGLAAQYGYFEARLLAPDAPGTWPAFWLLSAGQLRQGFEETPVDEVDIAEIYGVDSTKYCLAVHGWLTPEGADDIACEGYEHLDDVALSWHTYGARITEDGAEFYLDGVKVDQMGPLPNDDEPFHFLVTMALGGGWDVDLSATDGITDLYVDYVRVYA
ncbi:family 16 glycosylhydrolase [Demequina sp. NBRC 110054]|uniref:glycoside hydrolase family 16 protein n=1 Tax=Demequina sp. NBRC 110054 TaxID=1570343 RepID=UPI0009FFE8CA|nr:family 16 glycosylhydrolase [Demequina sp. NBRC 110054]